MKSMFEVVDDFLASGESVVLASVIANSGSTPREAGAKMIIRKNKEILGTIGGGRIEAEVQKLAADIFDNKQSTIKNFTLTADGIASIGMICGGQASVYLQYFDASAATTREVFAKIKAAYQANTRIWLITAVQQDEQCYELYLYSKDDSFENNLSSEILTKLQNNFSNKRAVINDGKASYIIEPIIGDSKAFIFGGGHIGCELVPVLSRLSFKTVLVEDREDFANKTRFPAADEIVVGEFAESFPQLAIDSNSYIVIVTRGHLNDEAVLAKALRTNATYIGMIGSRTKWDALYSRLCEQGFGIADLARVHAPIGLPIKAQAPEEIAISIAAEIIKVRAEKNG